MNCVHVKKWDYVEEEESLLQQTNVPGVSFSKVPSSRMEDCLVLHHLHTTFSV